MLFMVFGCFITHISCAALGRHTDIAVSVFNDFGHGFAGFGAFCYGFSVFATPPPPPIPPSEIKKKFGRTFPVDFKTHKDWLKGSKSLFHMFLFWSTVNQTRPY